MANTENHADQNMASRAASGGVLLLAGLVMLFFAWGYPTGTLNQMGAGFIPQAIAILISGLAVAIIIIDLKAAEPERAGPVHWRGLIFISAAVIIFAVLVDVAGLVPSMFLAVAVSMFADHQARPVPVLIYTLLATFFGWLLFLVGLELPIPAFWR
ncbi:tripartite tricarboxylate transporter TctB family protein [Primorskyibacter sedentarius]|uniref:tripartite tricarboxylate transporter TctB family protein n=1 Tax=Primorskyibacter sedentarius TaxID=745311 RepID=UPI003EBB6AD0